MSNRKNPGWTYIPSTFFRLVMISVRGFRQLANTHAHIENHVRLSILYLIMRYVGAASRFSKGHRENQRRGTLNRKKKNDRGKNTNETKRSSGTSVAPNIPIGGLDICWRMLCESNFLGFQLSEPMLLLNGILMPPSFHQTFPVHVNGGSKDTFQYKTKHFFSFFFFFHFPSLADFQGRPNNNSGKKKILFWSVFYSFFSKIF